MSGRSSMMKQLVLQLLLALNLSRTLSSQSIITRLPGFHGLLPFKLETGYVGVGREKEVQFFYYFVESERDPANDPLVLWISGGPGCTTLRAFFFEIGPFSFSDAKPSGRIPKLELNPYSWTKVANVIFLDQPVGTGFSYATSWEASRSSDTLSASETYEFLRQWLVDHPKFLSNPLYVSGTSYAGIVVPNIVLHIYNGNEAGVEPWMNVKGYVLGNPLTDKVGDLNSRVKYAYQMALLSDELYASALVNCRGNFVDADPRMKLCLADLRRIDECTDRINFPQILETDCGKVNSKPNLQRWAGSLLPEKNPIQLPTSTCFEKHCRGDDYVYTSDWATNGLVQEALRIRQGTVEDWARCNSSLFYFSGVDETAAYSFDVKNSVVFHEKLLAKDVRALIYSGDHDMVVPYVATQRWIRDLNLTVESPWQPWTVENQVAGYVETYSSNNYSLTYATVKGAGHTGAEYKPKECLAMADRWFNYSSL